MDGDSRRRRPKLRYARIHPRLRARRPLANRVPSRRYVVDGEESQLLGHSGSTLADDCWELCRRRAVVECGLFEPPTQYVLTISGEQFAFDDAQITMNYLGGAGGSYAGGVVLTWQTDALVWSAGDEVPVTLESR